MPDPITSSSASSTAASAATTAPPDVPPPPPAPKPAVHIELEGAHPMTDAERAAVLAFATAALGPDPSWAPIALTPEQIGNPKHTSPAELAAQAAAHKAEHEACVAETKKGFEEGAKSAASTVKMAAATLTAAVLPKVPGPAGAFFVALGSAIGSEAAGNGLASLAGLVGHAVGESSCD